MSHPSTATRRVEELERFGKALNDAPDDIFKGQGKLVFAAFRKKFGLLGLLPFAWRVMRARRRLLRDYAPQYAELQSRVSPELAKEVTMMIAMFNAIAADESTEHAYEFVKSIFQAIAPHSLRRLYQLDDLVECEGDVFDNFKSFNVASLRSSWGRRGRPRATALRALAHAVTTEEVRDDEFDIFDTERRGQAAQP